MYVHQVLSGTRTVLAVIPMLVVLLTGSNLASAQVVPAPVPAAAPAKAPIDKVKSTMVIAVDGTVPVGNDNVDFKKVSVEIGSTLSQDADPAVAPQLIIDIRFLKAAGTAVISKAKYESIAEFQIVKLFTPTKVLELTFPFTEVKAGKAFSALTPAESTQVLVDSPAGLATFNLTFDANGVVTGATGSIGANKFASAP
jgi:hypothetical protein